MEFQEKKPLMKQIIELANFQGGYITEAQFEEFVKEKNYYERRKISQFLKQLTINIGDAPSKPKRYISKRIRAELMKREIERRIKAGKDAWGL